MGEILAFPAPSAPDDEMVQTIQALLTAIKAGSVESCAVVVVKPSHSVEISVTGDLSPVGRICMLGAIAQLNHEVLTEPA